MSGEWWQGVMMAKRGGGVCVYVFGLFIGCFSDIWRKKSPISEKKTDNILEKEKKGQQRHPWCNKWEKQKQNKKTERKKTTKEDPKLCVVSPWFEIYLVLVLLSKNDLH